MPKLSIYELMVHIYTYDLVHDKSKNKSYISDVEKKYNPNQYHEIGRTNTNQFIKEIIYKYIQLVVSDDLIKQINENIDFTTKSNLCYEKINNRTAYINNKIYINMGNGKVKGISSSKIKSLKTSKAKFSISNNMGEITDPILKDGDIELLLKHINITPDEFKILIVAILNSFIDNTQHVMIAITGPAGSAKSTFHLFLQTIIDPTNESLQDQSNKLQDLVISAQHSHVVSMNNVSNLSNVMQNQICTLLTGGTSKTRALYTDNDQASITLHNPVIINGIGTVVNRDDLLDRTLLFILNKITRNKRKPESEVIAAFKNDLPIIMGGIFNTLSKILKIKQGFKTPIGLNRMADFHLLGLMTEEALKWDKGTFTHAYDKNISLTQGVVIDDSPIALAILLLNSNGLLPFKGTYMELCKLLKSHASTGEITPRKLTEELERIKPSLKRLHEIKIKKLGRTNKGAVVSISKTSH